MARKEETNAVKVMKEAKTAEEMVRSWGAQTPGRDMERTLELFKLYVERKPEMIRVFCHTPTMEPTDRGIMDRKTRELVLLGILMAIGSKEGILAHIANGRAAGCTEEEMLEVAYLAAYQAGKTSVAITCEALTDGFAKTANIKPFEP